MPDSWEDVAQEFNQQKQVAQSVPSGSSASPQASAPINNDWKIWLPQNTATTQQNSPSAFTGALKEYWNKVNPVSQFQGLAQEAAHPAQTVEGYGQQTAGLLDAAEDSFKKGNYAEGVRHGLSYLLNGVPGIGAALDEAGNKAQSGDYAGSAADTAALATNLAVGAKAPEIANTVRNVAGTVGPVAAGAVKGGITGGLETIHYGRHNIPIPASVAGAMAGKYIGEMAGPTGGAIGATVGAAAPMVRGAVQGGRAALEAVQRSRMPLAAREWDRIPEITPAPPIPPVYRNPRPGIPDVEAPGQPEQFESPSPRVVELPSGRKIGGPANATPPTNQPAAAAPTPAPPALQGMKPVAGTGEIRPGYEDVYGPAARNIAEATAAKANAAAEYAIRNRLQPPPVADPLHPTTAERVAWQDFFRQVPRANGGTYSRPLRGDTASIAKTLMELKRRGFGRGGVVEMAKGGVVVPKTEQNSPQHGKSIEDIVRGSADVPIDSRLGVSEANDLGRWFKQQGFGRSRNDVIIPGALTRSRQTMGIIAKQTGAKVLPPNRNQDTWSTGFEGMPTDQVKAKIREYVEKRPNEIPPDADRSTGTAPESFDHFRLRYLGALKQQMQQFLRNPHQRIMRGTHGRGIRLTRAWAAKGFPDDLSVDPKYLLDDSDSPAEVYRLAPGPKGKWQYKHIDITQQRPTNRTHGQMGSGIWDVRHAATPWNHETQQLNAKKGVA